MSETVVLPITWDIEKTDWPWNHTHGQNRAVAVYLGDVKVLSISVCEVIEASGNKFVSAHLKECQDNLLKFNDE